MKTHKVVLDFSRFVLNFFFIQGMSKFMRIIFFFLKETQTVTMCKSLTASLFCLPFLLLLLELDPSSVSAPVFVVDVYGTFSLQEPMTLV